MKTIFFQVHLSPLGKNFSWELVAQGKDLSVFNRIISLRESYQGINTGKFTQPITGLWVQHKKVVTDLCVAFENSI